VALLLIHANLIERTNKQTQAIYNAGNGINQMIKSRNFPPIKKKKSFLMYVEEYRAL